jgi:heat shock protein 1/8
VCNPIITRLYQGGAGAGPAPGAAGGVPAAGGAGGPKIEEVD